MSKWSELTITVLYYYTVSRILRFQELKGQAVLIHTVCFSTNSWLIISFYVEAI